jgi:hypothetical protein
MDLSSYIVEKCAGILAEQDVKELFDILTEKLEGNRSESARHCGLTGKATYDWEKARYLKLATKRKVLKACLETDFLGTVEYLLNRNCERTDDLLRTVLCTVYADAVEAGLKEKFISSFDKFEVLRMKYRGFIRDQNEDEVSNMALFLESRALDFGVPLPEKSIDDLSAQELLGKIELIGRAYVESPTKAEHLATENLGLPKETLKPILQTFGILSQKGEVNPPSDATALEWPNAVPDVRGYLPRLAAEETAQFPSLLQR